MHYLNCQLGFWNNIQLYSNQLKIFFCHEDNYDSFVWTIALYIILPENGQIFVTDVLTESAFL